MTKKKYKALILDVDGTTIPNSRDGMPSKRVTDAIRNANQKLIVGLASGRPYEDLNHIAKHLELSGPLIVNGGARVVDSKGKTLWEKIINTHDVIEIKNIFFRYNTNCFIYDNGRDVIISKEYIPERALQIYSQGLDPEVANQIIEKISTIKTVSVHTVHSWTRGRVDVMINHTSATKQHGILEFAKLLGLNTHEIIGVGDGNNDFPLLMACGLKVAMGNASDDLKAIADYVAPTVDEDGVADVIEKFIL